jgi:hypothetical protein
VEETVVLKLGFMRWYVIGIAIPNLYFQINSFINPDIPVRARTVYSVYTVNSFLIITGLIYSKVKNKPRLIFGLMILSTLRNLLPFYNDDGGTGLYTNNMTILTIMMNYVSMSMAIMTISVSGLPFSRVVELIFSIMLLIGLVYNTFTLNLGYEFTTNEVIFGSVLVLYWYVSFKIFINEHVLVYSKLVLEVVNS